MVPIREGVQYKPPMVPMRANLMILERLDFVRHRSIDLFKIKLIHINNKMLPGECYDFSREQHQYY